MNTPDWAVIFDMDGVLTDSITRCWQAYNIVLGRHGVHIADPEIGAYLGRTVTDQLALFKQNFGLELDQADFVEETDALKIGLQPKLEPNPGVIDLINGLIAAGVPHAVGTSSQRFYTMPRLAEIGLEDKIPVIITADEIEAHKPAPDVYLRAAHDLGVEPSRCIVIEDAPAGVQAAQAAGMHCVAHLTPFVPEETLGTPDLKVQSLAELSVDRLKQLIAG